ncbi:BlaI/MecI/CopY family transcriptional regulator [Amycolatopsis sp. 195334CR]|uniref:BlaI/MecI/CopY family transcriptional regulator n=1 Tax=Amycolatopsis sp. 195334CR TaxID=2814588 RepID=UPI001A8C6934|nr:BlaI/MecI/CopY family transcriptional regulator [Amycolatopsis sp. 195334CR]MBN6038290.1 BlaI/MecI/CopY family transcriptional regulator [Amycolatopsis sp. 195334CR]
MRRLGELETSVMDVLWRTPEPMLVRAVLDELNRDRNLAYTTVMTVLDNLFRKDWVTREREGRAYRYRAAVSREEAAAQALRDVLDAAGDSESVLLHFAKSVSDSESDALRKALRRRPKAR